MANHLLLCPACEHKIEVETRQAGQSLQCSGCGIDVEAPKLGELRKLPVAQTDLQTASKKSVSGIRKVLFAVGLGMAVLFGAAGLSLHLYARSLYVPVDVASILEKSQQEAEKLTDVEVYQIASDINRVQTTTDFREPPFLKANKQSAILSYFAYGLYAIAGLGLLMLIGSFIVK